MILLPTHAALEPVLRLPQLAAPGNACAFLVPFRRVFRGRSSRVLAAIVLLDLMHLSDRRPS